MRILLWLLAALVTAQEPPPQLPRQLMASATQSSSVPASPVAVVTWMARGEAKASSDMLFVIWRGQPGWYRSARHSSSGGSTPQSFSASATYGTVRVDLEVDLVRRIAHVQDIRVELGEANVILVDDVDQPNATRVIKTLRVEPSGELGRGPAAALRFLGSSQEIVSFLGCDRTDPGEPGGVPGFCWTVVGQNGRQE